MFGIGKHLMKGKTMKELSDNEKELILAGQVIFAHKAISAGLICPDEAADLLGMDESHLLRLFDKLGLDQPEKALTFEQMLNESGPREIYYTSEEIRTIFLSDEEGDKGKKDKQ